MVSASRQTETTRLDRRGGCGLSVLVTVPSLGCLRIGAQCVHLPPTTLGKMYTPHAMPSDGFPRPSMVRCTLQSPACYGDVRGVLLQSWGRAAKTQFLIP